MKEDEKGISFVNIPIEIFSNKELTANEKILYGYLSIFKKQCCFQSNDSIAAALGISENTVSSGIKHLTDLGYVFVEFLNGNSAARRVYIVFDNPKKLKYLIGKGYLKSFPQVPKNWEGPKNCAGVPKNWEGQNRGEVPKNWEHRIINNNKNIVEAPALAKKEPSRASNKEKPLLISKSGLDDAEYERQFYERNTITI